MTVEGAGIYAFLLHIEPRWSPALQALTRRLAVCFHVLRGPIGGPIEKTSNDPKSLSPPIQAQEDGVEWDARAEGHATDG